MEKSRSYAVKIGVLDLLFKLEIGNKDDLSKSRRVLLLTMFMLEKEESKYLGLVARLHNLLRQVIRMLWP